MGSNTSHPRRRWRAPTHRPARASTRCSPLRRPTASAQPKDALLHRSCHANHLCQPAPRRSAMAPQTTHSTHLQKLQERPAQRRHARRRRARAAQPVQPRPVAAVHRSEHAVHGGRAAVHKRQGRRERGEAAEGQDAAGGVHAQPAAAALAGEPGGGGRWSGIGRVRKSMFWVLGALGVESHTVLQQLRLTGGVARKKAPTHVCLWPGRSRPPSAGACMHELRPAPGQRAGTLRTWAAAGSARSYRCWRRG